MRIRTVVGIIAGMGATLLVGCSAGGNTENASTWESLRIAAVEVEHYEDYRSMGESADIVAKGQFKDVFGIRTIQGDAPEDQVFYAQLAFSVRAAVVGQEVAEDDPIVVEFLIPALDEASAEAAVKDLIADTAAEEYLLFLRHKGGEEAGLYRLVNSLGLWTSSGDGVVHAPLAFSEDVAGFKESAEEVATVDEIVAAVRG